MACTHREVLEQAGFTYEGSFAFERDDIWTIESLIGFMYSTSILSRPALGSEVAAFEADLTRRLAQFSSDGTFKHEATCSYDLVRPTRKSW